MRSTNIELTKGGFPARYGRRLSLMLDIPMKEANDQAFHDEGAIRLVATRITLEDPIRKNIASFIGPARRTYIDVLALPFVRAQLASEK